MTQKNQAIDLTILDGKDIKKLKEKEKKIERVMDIIRENELEKDPEFMEHIDDLIGKLIEEK